MAPARTTVVPTTGLEARLLSRTNQWHTPTSGVAGGYLQANIIILPSQFARDFTIFCARNPVPCPLLASSAAPGDFKNFTSHIPGIPGSKIAADLDIRTDAPKYNVYLDGEINVEGSFDVNWCWDPTDHVAFLIGCSYSFENALTAAGLPPTHLTYGRNTSMYRTTLPLCPAGVFSGSTYVVSMRMYPASEVERVRRITRPYVTTHGEPIAWGWNGMRSLGISDINLVTWGEPPVDQYGSPIDEEAEQFKEDGLVPVFWGCGVTPQQAVMDAKTPGMVMSHTPGYMLVMDVKEEDVLGKI